LPSQVLGGHVTVAVHENDEWIASIVLHHQGLDDEMLVKAKLSLRHTRPSPFLIAILVLGKWHGMLSEKVDRWR
jgi:hypothetical protein